MVSKLTRWIENMWGKEIDWIRKIIFWHQLFSLISLFHLHFEISPAGKMFDSEDKKCFWSLRILVKTFAWFSNIICYEKNSHKTSIFHYRVNLSRQVLCDTTNIPIKAHILVYISFIHVKKIKLLQIYKIYWF